MSFRNESLFEICVGPISQRNTPGSITSPDTGEPFTQLYRKLTNLLAIFPVLAAPEQSGTQRETKANWGADCEWSRGRAEPEKEQNPRATQLAAERAQSRARTSAMAEDLSLLRKSRPVQK
jgi:hypothetical protein